MQAQKHVMLSYSWNDKATVLRLAESLQLNGYRIWIDEEQIHKSKSLLQAMAEGASNSAVVIVCVSPSYETSQNCELEANYIHGHRIPHIHVMIEKIYRPPSWLGVFAAGPYFHTFSVSDTNGDWDQKFAKLMQTLHVHGVERSPIDPALNPIVPHTPIATHTSAQAPPPIPTILTIPTPIPTPILPPIPAPIPIPILTLTPTPPTTSTARSSTTAPQEPKKYHIHLFGSTIHLREPSTSIAAPSTFTSPTTTPVSAALSPSPPPLRPPRRLQLRVGGHTISGPSQHQESREEGGHLQTLVDMGFERKLALRALATSGDNLDVAVDKLLSQTKPSARGSAERDEDGEDDADSDWEEAGKQKKGKRPAVKKENDRRVANQANAETHATERKTRARAKSFKQEAATPNAKTGGSGDGEESLETTMCGLSIKQEHPHPQKQRGQTEAMEIGRKFRREGGVLRIPKFSPAPDVFVMSEAYNKYQEHVEKYAREKILTAANAMAKLFRNSLPLLGEKVNFNSAFAGPNLESLFRYFEIIVKGHCALQQMFPGDEIYFCYDWVNSVIPARPVIFKVVREQIFGLTHQSTAPKAMARMQKVALLAAFSG